MLDARDTPLVEGGVDGAEGREKGVEEEGGGGVGLWGSVTGTTTFTSSLLESLLPLSGGSELFRKSNSMSSSTSCSLFLRLTNPEEVLAEADAEAEALLPEPERTLDVFAAPSSVDPDLLMFAAAAETKLCESSVGGYA